MVKTEAAQLNVVAMTQAACLEQLCMAKIGGILLVTMIPAQDGSKIPFLMVVTVLPALAMHHLVLHSSQLHIKYFVYSIQGAMCHHGSFRTNILKHAIWS